VNRWHATNKKSHEKANSPANSIASRRSGLSTPCTDTEYKKVIVVDDIPDLDDDSLEF